MFTPKLGRVSVQNASASPGAWAQLHPDKLSKLATSSHNRPILFGKLCGPSQPAARSVRCRASPTVARWGHLRSVTSADSQIAVCAVQIPKLLSALCRFPNCCLRCADSQIADSTVGLGTRLRIANCANHTKRMRNATVI